VPPGAPAAPGEFRRPGPPPGDRGAPRPRPRREFRGRYAPRRKVCRFCADKIPIVDYKDVPRLRSHISDRGKIEPRRKTGTCARHQRALATAIKRARHVALLPFTGEHLRISGMSRG
jgi:small subunit ribosomal protein S18